MKWKLPKAFKPDKRKKGFKLRHDGEPRFVSLLKYINDRTLRGQEWISCCDCGLIHLHTYNVIRTPDGLWHLIVRAFRAPNNKKKKC
jgi:hypothetical protein